MASEHENKPTKRIYEKPAVKTIELVAGEVLATGCKQTPIAVGIFVNPCLAAICNFLPGS